MDLRGRVAPPRLHQQQDSHHPESTRTNGAALSTTNMNANQPAYNQTRCGSGDGYVVVMAFCFASKERSK
eukprot:m.481485 g.481485  ORF g.481485 m.481485 type:complete len:70 (+) comp22179_c0_seq1:1902-2111(+)